MKHYWFGFRDEKSELCGEEILVGANSFVEAQEIVEEEFPGEWPTYYGIMTDMQAECSGLDEY